MIMRVNDKVFVLAVLMCLATSVSAKVYNETPSPDGTMCAYTGEDHNLYVKNEQGIEVQLTFDGSDLIMNGYASWVYYEEIFGRPSKYKAFWWSPDSKKIAFYRFDNSLVPMFPIYSPFGQQGHITQTRYPKAGEPNPKVRVGIVSVDGHSDVVWADFDQDEDQYFGTPFWCDDSQKLFVQWMPRVQQELRLYSVDAEKGKLETIYKEEYPTWVNWMDDMLFASDGLYMVRDFETLWQQIYFLSYDGKTFTRLTDGINWRISLVKLNEKTREVYFTSHRDSDVHSCLYKVNAEGKITLLSDPMKNVDRVEIADDFKSYSITLSDINSQPVTYHYKVGRRGKITETSVEKSEMELPQDRPVKDIVYLSLEDGTRIPASVALPKDFDSSKQYPLVMEIYGGPDTPYVNDRWRGISDRDMWYYNNGIIKVVADTRAAGHNGRAGLDLIYRDLVSVPVQDFVSWAAYLGSLPYVDASRIGVEGFSFGGTMTAMLVMTHPECFKCGIAGGGVYDWILYDTHYTERFMDTPSRNPDGYAVSRVLNYVPVYDDSLSFLKLTHGTGDDNVHFQNTLQLINELEINGKQFELMIYPDGMHGYRGLQGEHDRQSDYRFWKEHFYL